MSLLQYLSTLLCPFLSITDSEILLILDKWGKVHQWCPMFRRRNRQTAAGWSEPWTATHTSSLSPHSHQSLVSAYKRYANPGAAEMQANSLEGENTGENVSGGLHISLPSPSSPHTHFGNRSSFSAELFQPLISF